MGARTLWSLYRKHPWLAQLGPLTRPLLVPNLMVHGEWVLGALDGHGLAPTTLFDIHVLIYSHVQGLAGHLELEAHTEAATGQSEDQWMDTRAPALRSTIPRALGRGFIVADAARRARTRSRSPGRGPALSRSAATVARRRQLVVAPRYNQRSDGALAGAARAARARSYPDVSKTTAQGWNIGCRPGARRSATDTELRQAPRPQLPRRTPCTAHPSAGPLPPPPSD
ncbi:hypothetical protein O1L55_05135 [Streptomyces albulus]|uniref:hypothetical protein n=1 Tax=Streptomyces noursei TaxID=1971 RepID=UPI0022BAFA8E|nr:hypothetical protein [Streptomyces noursei]